MFIKAKNIDTTFRQMRLFCLITVIASTVITCFTVYRSFRLENLRSQQVLILPTGKVVEAVTTDRKNNLDAELRDHVRTFHEYFFWLEPDDKLNHARTNRALYLADASAKKVYDDLKESGFYANVVSGNVTQRITVDSIHMDTHSYPYYFRCYARLEIIRSTSIAIRNLTTQGQLRDAGRSENNSHGFLIEHWAILENSDISVKQRR